MKYLKEIIERNKLLVSIYLLLGTIIAFLHNFTANYFQRLIDRFSSGTLSINIIIIYGIILIITIILEYLDECPGRKLEHGIFLDLKLKALEKIRYIDYQCYQKIGTGKLVQRIENGALAGKSILFDFIFCLIRELIPSIIFSLIFICYINKTVMIMILFGYAGVFIVTNLLLKFLYEIKERILTNEEKLNHYLVRGFMELVVFRLNKRFEHQITRSRLAKDEIVKSKVKMTLIHEAFFTIFALLVTIIKIVIIVYGWITRTLTIGQIVALITLLDNAYTPIAIFNVLFVQYKLDKTAYNRYTDFLDSKNDEQLLKGTKIFSLKGNIAIKGLMFLYDKRVIFNDLNLNIEFGEKIALVGKSGSGKSTLIKLIVGLLKFNEGSIKIDNYNLSDINLKSYYDHITYIPQESPIFDGTLRENLVFDENLDDNKLIQVLEQVNLIDLYNKLEKGLNTELGEKGVALSGGERQRLALARLWFSHSNIIILDEATSAMDNITEKTVMKNVMKLLNNKTVIVIAHRLNSIQCFNRIVAFKDGKIVGDGSFDELLNYNLYFKELYNEDESNK